MSLTAWKIQIFFITQLCSLWPLGCNDFPSCLTNLSAYQSPKETSRSIWTFTRACRWEDPVKKSAAQMVIAQMGIWTPPPRSNMHFVTVYPPTHTEDIMCHKPSLQGFSKKDCHDFRFSIVRIVISVSKVTSLKERFLCVFSSGGG